MKYIIADDLTGANDIKINKKNNYYLLYNIFLR